MSHKKCLISEVFLESIYGISLFLFCIVHKSCLCTKFQIWMSKVSNFNFSLNTHFFVKTISSVNPYFLVRHFHCCLTGNAFWHIQLPNVSHLFDSFLSIHFLVWAISFYNPLFHLATDQSLFHRQCLLPHPTHHHKCHLSMAATPTTQQNNTSHVQAMSPPCCPPAASHFPH